MNRLTSYDRRRPGRPSSGDGRTCPGCGQPTCHFNARYQFGEDVIPAWVCAVPSCRYCEVLRRGMLGTPPSQVTLDEAREVQARARRVIMRSAARAARTRRHIAATTTRLRKSR